jgi:hypothetical protein
MAPQSSDGWFPATGIALAYRSSGMGRLLTEPAGNSGRWMSRDSCRETRKSFPQTSPGRDGRIQSPARQCRESKAPETKSPLGDGTTNLLVRLHSNLKSMFFANTWTGKGGTAWATVIRYPMTRISPHTNWVVGQWHGDEGDSIRVGYGSLWLTNLKGGKVWRLSFPSGANH